MNSYYFIAILLGFSLLFGLFVYFCYQAYLEIMTAILKPVCPITKCLRVELPACDCEYDIACVAMGHCPDCPKTYKQELIETQILLENCQTLIK